MSAEEMDGPFDSIESAHEFRDVLAQTILQAMKELDQAQLEAHDGNEQRRAQAIELARFKLKMLCGYVHKSRRALNDLRTIRRLILGERAGAKEMAARAA